MVTTTPITGTVVLPDGTAFTAGVLTFTLAGVDTQSSVVFPGTSLSVALNGITIPSGFGAWPNTGSNSYYIITLKAKVTVAPGLVVKKTYTLAAVKVGSAATYLLSDLITFNAVSIPASGAVPSGATSISLTTQATGTLQPAQMPALTGDVTTIAGALATTIAANAVTNAQLATMAANTVKVNATAGVASPTDMAVGVSQLMGRGATGNIAPITLGANLTMTGTTLAAIGGGGSGNPLLGWFI